MESSVLRFVLDTLTRSVRLQEAIFEARRFAKSLVSAPRRPLSGLVPRHKSPLTSCFAFAKQMAATGGKDRGHEHWCRGQPGDCPAEPPGGEHGLARSLFADPRFGPLPALLVTLTVVTGVVDAVSILALGRVFVANMTGNVVFAAFALVGAPGFSLSASLFALAGFLVGAYAGGLMIARSADRGALLRAGTAAEVLLAAVALLIAALSGDPGASHGTLHLGTAGAFGAAVTDVLACLLAVALGIQNAVARKLAVPDMTTTVLTMTLTGLGADLRAARHRLCQALPGDRGAGRARPTGCSWSPPWSRAARPVPPSPCGSARCPRWPWRRRCSPSRRSAPRRQARGGSSARPRGARFPRARADLLLGASLTSPQTSAATSVISSSFAFCSSAVSALPCSVDAKPHCPDRHSWSRSTYLAASSMRRLRSSFDSSSGRLVVTRPRTTCLPGGTKRSGSKPPERSSSYSRKNPSTSSPLNSASATNS